MHTLPAWHQGTETVLQMVDPPTSHTAQCLDELSQCGGLRTEEGSHCPACRLLPVASSFTQPILTERADPSDVTGAGRQGLMQFLKKESQGKEQQGSVGRSYTVLREEALHQAGGQALAADSLRLFRKQLGLWPVWRGSQRQDRCRGRNSLPGRSLSITEL